MWSFFKKKYPVIFPAGTHGMSNEFVDREVLGIMDHLRRKGFEAYLVGGSIRDILLGKRVKDFDIVTDAHPRQIKRLFKRCFLIGKRFRLAHVYVGKDRFIEVATFRALVDPGEIKDTGKKYAENNVFGTIEEDALRRDFTINALYYNSADSSIEDYTGGMDDIKKDCSVPSAILSDASKKIPFELYGRVDFAPNWIFRFRAKNEKPLRSAPHSLPMPIRADCSKSSIKFFAAEHRPPPSKICENLVS
jgi:poly(A) polymerase